MVLVFVEARRRREVFGVVVAESGRDLCGMEEGWREGGREGGGGVRN